MDRSRPRSRFRTSDPAAEISGSARYKSATRTLAEHHQVSGFSGQRVRQPDRGLCRHDQAGHRSPGIPWNNLSADEKAKVETVLGLPPIAVEQQQAAAAHSNRRWLRRQWLQTQAAASPNPATAGAAVTPSMMADDTARSRLQALALGGANGSGA